MDFKYEIGCLLSRYADMDIDEITKTIETPPSSDMGDYAFPCFRLAKTMRKAPPAIALELKEKISLPSYLTRIETKGAYLNFFIEKSFYVKTILENLLEKGESFGDSNEGLGKTVVIDYSSPNIAKPFHVGHLRSTVIGGALYRIYSALGYNCVGINHLGDWGTQFGKLISAYKRWGSKEDIEKRGISALMEIYVKFHEEAKNMPELEDEARGYFVKMQEGDKEALDLWKWFYDISIKEFLRIYDRLDIRFDALTGESFYNDKMDAVVSELEEKGLLEESDGAKIVSLEDEKMPPCLILRKDGGTLYATRDLAAAFYRKKTYDFDKALYLTALDQNLHFAQWFKVVEKMGYPWAKDLVHVPFGLVSLESGKLSTRQGKVILMEDLLDEAVSETLKIINEKNPSLPDKEQVSKDVGIGAVIFNDLYNSRIKDVVFSWERMLNFDGETGPYVQYTHARTASVLEKAGINNEDLEKTFKSLSSWNILTDDASVSVCKLIEEFPSKISEAAAKNEPYILTRHIVNIAQSFNKFYHDNEILTKDEETKKSRLLLTFAVKKVLAKGLSLLGIKTPDHM